MPSSTSGNANHELFDAYRIGSVAQVAMPSVAAGPTRHARLQQMAAELRHGEALWLSNKTPVQGTVVAFHDPDDVDETLVPCFMLPSLPQQSTDFIDLAGMMDPRQPFFAAYTPSELRVAETASTVDKLAQHYANAIHKVWPSGPIAVGGWSAGPIVALAVTERLRELGHAVPLLVAIDGAPPSIDIGRPGLFEKARLTSYRLANAVVALVQLGRDLARRIRRRSPQDGSLRGTVRSAWQKSAFRPIWQRAAGAIAGKVVGRFLGKRLTQRHPAEAATDTSNLPPDHRSFVTALYDAVWAYVPGADYSGEVVVFESTAEPARSSSNIAKRWARIATNLTIVPVDGSHMSMIADPDGRPLARWLCQKLREVSVQQPGKVRAPAAAPKLSMAAMTTRNAAHRGDASSPAG